MRAGSNDGNSLQHRLARFLMKYHATPHATTNRSPCSLFLRRTICTHLDLLKLQRSERVLDKQAQQVKCHDQYGRCREISVGQQVMVRNYRSEMKWVPTVIVHCLGPLTYLVETRDGMRWRHHIDQIRGRDSTFMSSEQVEQVESSVDTEVFTSVPPEQGDGEQQQNSSDSSSTASAPSTLHHYRSCVRNPPD